MLLGVNWCCFSWLKGIGGFVPYRLIGFGGVIGRVEGEGVELRGSAEGFGHGWRLFADGLFHCKLVVK